MSSKTFQKAYTINVTIGSTNIYSATPKAWTNIKQQTTNIGRVFDCLAQTEVFVYVKLHSVLPEMMDGIRYLIHELTNKYSNIIIMSIFS